MSRIENRKVIPEEVEKAFELADEIWCRDGGDDGLAMHLLQKSSLHDYDNIILELLCQALSDERLLAVYRQLNCLLS